LSSSGPGSINSIKTVYYTIALCYDVVVFLVDIRGRKSEDRNNNVRK